MVVNKSDISSQIIMTGEFSINAQLSDIVQQILAFCHISINKCCFSFLYKLCEAHNCAIKANGLMENIVAAY